MKPVVFFGGAIQGASDRPERARVHRRLMSVINESGYQVYSEHTGGRDFNETARLMEGSIGPLPPPGAVRSAYVRKLMIQGIEGDLAAAVFEASIPSLGTGVEIAHAYLRARLGLSPIPILILYETDRWPGGLSAMVRGVPQDEVPGLFLKEYRNIEQAEELIRLFLSGLDS